MGRKQPAGPAETAGTDHLGGEMREIVDADQIGRIFVLLAVLLPPLGAIIGLIIGLIIGGKRQSRVRGAVVGLVFGLCGPLNLAMWSVFNKTTDVLGLDTVRNLAVNVGIFLAVGAVIGIGAGFAVRYDWLGIVKQRPSDKVE